MAFKKEFSDLRLSFRPLTLYQKFEHISVLILTALIAVIVVLALWNLTLKILLSIWATNFDPTDYAVFQTVFGMIFTVMIALEFKRSLLVVAERRDGVVQVRSVILIALLAVVRKLIILDLSSTDAFHLLARRRHPRAGRRLLAGAQPTSAARKHRGGSRMRFLTRRRESTYPLAPRPDCARNFIDALRWRRSEPGSDPQSAGRRRPL